MANQMSIADYYRGKHVFITGGTGFIGKVLIEKILRSCPGIAGVYCLVRPKNGKAAQQRINDLLEEMVGKCSDVNFIEYYICFIKKTY